MTPQYLLLVATLVAVAVVLLRYNLWRAVLFVSPSSLRIDAEDPGAAKSVPEALRGAEASLLESGFRALGTHSERPVLGPARLCWNYLHPGEGTVATLFEGDDGVHAWFVSRLEGGGYVITANYRRPAREVAGRYASGYLEDVPLDRVYRAHTRRLAGLQVRTDPLTLEDRVELQRAWYGGLGKPEVRQENFRGLLWSLGTLGMVAAAIFAGARR